MGFFDCIIFILYSPNADLFLCLMQLKVKFCEKGKPSSDYFVTLEVKIKILKKVYQIAITILAILSVPFTVAASVNGDEKKQDNQEQDGRAKSDAQGLRPDGDYNSISSERENNQQFETEDSQQSLSDATFTELNPDSLEDDSVSKYNFLFYFLYKFKYDSEESP